MIAKSSIYSLLVFGKNNARAIPTQISATAFAKKGDTRIEYTGTASFSPDLKAHALEVIIPLIDEVTVTLGLRRRSFVVGGENVSAASKDNRTVHISGFSADVPLFCILLASALRLPVRSSLAATGHIGSQSGDVRAVTHLAEKISAAKASEEISEIIVPSIKSAESVRTLDPVAFERDRTAIKAGRIPLGVHEIDRTEQIADLIFDDYSIVLAALRSGYFDRKANYKGKAKRLVETFASARERLNDVLENSLRHGYQERISGILNAFIEYHLRRRRYPENFGRRLELIAASIPPIILRESYPHPIVSHERLNRLKQLEDYDDNDWKTLNYLCIEGGLGKPRTCLPKLSSKVTIRNEENAKAALDHLIGQLGARELAVHVDGPINKARASFTLKNSTVRDDTNLIEIIGSFLVHVRVIQGKIETAPDMKSLSAEVIDLTSRTFTGNGIEQALAIAKSGVNGGIRAILDEIATQMIREETRNYIRYRVALVCPPDDYHLRVRILDELNDRFRMYLPDEWQTKPTEHLARNLETLLESFFCHISRPFTS